MNHSELVTTLAASIELTKTDTSEILSVLYQIIADELLEGQEVTLHGLGKLKVKQTNARTMKNPQTGAAINVPAKTKVVFVSSSTLKQELNRA